MLSFVLGVHTISIAMQATRATAYHDHGHLWCNMLRGAGPQCPCTTRSWATFGMPWSHAQRHPRSAFNPRVSALPLRCQFTTSVVWLRDFYLGTANMCD